ncbi:MAG: hypothetical protein M3Y33_20790, partial [Actinomycetota bacterium]|nr:hypothetical protein [Actinomycetota bacterium]
VSERYRLHYCRALGITPGQFGPPGPGDLHSREVRSPGGLVAGHAAARISPEPGTSSLRTSRDVDYRWIRDAVWSASRVEREVLMTAHEGSEHAELAERRDIGEATLEQLRADVARLSRDYESGETLPLFLEMRRVRSRIYAALDRRLWPRDANELYLLAGCLSGLMATAARNLGYPQAAEELLRAGWAYATIVGHGLLMAQLRMGAADVAYWDGRPRQSRDLAGNGLEYLRDGQNAAQLHLKYGLAAARLGDARAARRAIDAASEARGREHSDELLDIGGNFSFSRAAQHYYAGFALLDIPQADAEAITQLQRAADLYARGPQPGEYHSYQLEAQARIDLATACLRAGQLDAAVAAAQPVLALPPGKRVRTLPERFRSVRAELASPRYQGSPAARDLDAQIEEFCSETITAELSDLRAEPT